MIYHSPEEFESKLVELIEDGTLRQRLAHNAYAYVKNHRLLSQHVHQRCDWYRKMHGELPRLNEELRARVPELFQ